MVSLSDIPVVGTLMGRISDAAVDLLFRGCGYLFFYKDGVTNLKSKIEQLTNQGIVVFTKAEKGKNDGKNIYDHVLKWQQDVKEIQSSAKEFEKKFNNRSSWRCIPGLPIPTFSRFQIGRDAEHMAKQVTELIENGKRYVDNEIAYFPPSENVPRSDTRFHDFQSREDAYKKLWEELTKGSSMILGIYGMAGVGKTRMMEQIWQQVHDEKIFDKVTRADVGSEKLDVIKVQDQIAGHLDCHFKSHVNEDSRASQLENSIKNAGKILVILDDVWQKIPLKRIGIPLGDGSRCKILLTSRIEKVCTDNSCMQPVWITPLREDEAWEMFKDTVGECIDKMGDKDLAQKVCKRCAGLPLLIRAVGNALQTPSHHHWEDALDKLEKGKFDNIANIDENVYTCLKLSIDKLPDDAKPYLFLCSLYPEDADIPIRKLIRLARGTHDLRSSSLIEFKEARVRTMVDHLRSSSLVLDSQKSHVIKLHDLIRDVARSIAARDQDYAFSFVKCGLQLPDNADHYVTRKLLLLDRESDDVHISNDRVFANLHSLWLQCNKHIQQFSGGFFTMFVNLKFLLIEGMSSSKELQFSLQSLGKLRTLILDKCNVSHIDQKKVNLFPENLETLCIWDCHLPVPLYLQNLKSLIKLEIEGLEVQLVPNTISNMSNLEELHILPNGFKIWNGGCEISPDAVSAEISKLTNLKSLRMLFRDSEPFHETNMFGNLRQYDICVGQRYFSNDLDKRSFVKKSIEFHGNRLQVLKSLIERAEEVILHLSDINVGDIYNRNREAFTDLRCMVIYDCKTMEYLARISENEILQHSPSQPSFSKLTTLVISNCSAIKYLFSKSIAKCLEQLDKLRVCDCPIMEAIVMNDGTSDGGDIIKFSKLKSLELGNLPRLKSFFGESITHKLASSGVHAQPLFDDDDGMVAFPLLEHLDIRQLAKCDTIWGKYLKKKNNIIVSSSSSDSFCKLKTLRIEYCDKLETVFPLSPMLHSLHNLEDVYIEGCHGLRNVFQHSSIARDLIQHLKRLDVHNCKMMREIIGGEQQEEEITNDDDITVFPQLTQLILYYLPDLSSFWCHHTAGEAANTFKVRLPNLVNFIYEWCGLINFQVIELGTDVFNCQLRQLDITCGQQQQLPVTWQLRLYNLEILTLSNYSWWHELIYPCFKRLEVLTVHHPNGSTLFSFSVFESLQQLRRLHLSNCYSLKEILEDVSGDEPSGTHKKTVTLFRLKSITLKDLTGVKSYFHAANYEWYMPALEEMEVDNCGFSTLFTCSVFRTLKQLKNLRVSNCRLLKDIVEDAKGDETSDTNDEITLPQLSRLDLKNLRKLKCFSSTSSYAFNMPKLSEFYLHGCPQMEKFTSLKTSTRLVSVYSDWHKGEEYADLNECIRENRRREDSCRIELGTDVSNCQLRHLDITCRQHRIQLPDVLIGMSSTVESFSGPKPPPPPPQVKVLPSRKHPRSPPVLPDDCHSDCDSSSSVVDVGASSSVCKPLSFDLNLPPPDGGDDDLDWTALRLSLF